MMIEIGYTDILYILISVVSFCLYLTLAKKLGAHGWLITMFWMHTLSYGIYLFIYLIKKFALLHYVNAI